MRVRAPPASGRLDAGACAGRRYRPRAMRVWIDLTNSPHVLVMRPVIERLRADGPRRARDRARLRPDARAVRALRHRAHADRPPPRRAARGQGGRPGLALDGARALGARPTRAPRRGSASTSRSGHGSNDVTRRRRAAADPQLDDVRLRVGDGPAPRQLPPGARGGRARGDPRRAPATATARAASCALRGAQGGVLPRRLRARRGGARGARRSSRERPIVVCARRRRCRCTTASTTTCSRTCSTALRDAAAERGGAVGGAAAHRAPSARSWARCRASSSPSTRSTRSR